MKRLLLTLAALGAVATMTAAALIQTGFYDVAATGQHLAPVFRLIEYAMRRSVRTRAEDINVPPLGQPATIERGLALFRQHCVQCHGAPGVAPEPFALGLRPAAANLAFTARDWSAGEIYWVVRNGVRMTGMPAWQSRLAESDLWAVVAFVRKLPELSPRDYQQLAAAVAPHAPAPEPTSAPPDAERGRKAMLRYACISCHRIPGVVGPDAPVGPPLEGMGSRGFIAGVLPNEPEDMVRWLRSPQAVAPLSAMPDLGVGEQDARDMAAYLATLR